MVVFSRRQLAKYAVDRILAGKKTADISKHLAAALIAGKMRGQADMLLDDIAEELEARGLVARTVVTSAKVLSTSLKKQLINRVKKAADVDEVMLSEQIDPDVIGGFRLETARRTWDKTIVRKLSEIKGGV